MLMSCPVLSRGGVPRVDILTLASKNLLEPGFCKFLRMAGLYMSRVAQYAYNCGALSSVVY